MPLLKFYAREDLLVFRPHVTIAPGSPEQYVGRRFDPVTKSYPAKKEASGYDPESPQGKRLIELVRREGCLWPADAETAAACGVKFPTLKFVPRQYRGEPSEGDAWVAEAAKVEIPPEPVPVVEPVIAPAEVKPAPEPKSAAEAKR